MKTTTFIILVLILWSVLFFAAGYKWRDHRPEVEHKDGDPIGNSKPMKRLQVPDDNTGMRIDPNAGYVSVMSPRQYEQFLKEGEIPKLKVEHPKRYGFRYDIGQPKSKIHVHGSVGLMPLGWNPSEKLDIRTGNYYHFEGYKPNAFKPYSVKVKDEHNVILTTDNDTIVLYLENATNMAEEKLIYILPPK